MNNPLVHGFRGLARFNGRDRRRQFWPYAGLVFAMAFLTMGVGASLTLGSFFTEVYAFAAEHPEATTVNSSPGQVSIQIDPGHPEAPVPNLSGFFWTLRAGVATIVLLLAAAVARRLHDTGRSAWWGLGPVIFLSAGLTLFPHMMQTFMEDDTPDLRLFGLLFANNLLYMVSLVALIVMLALPGKREPNRFGPFPA